MAHTIVYIVPAKNHRNFLENWHQHFGGGGGGGGEACSWQEEKAMGQKVLGRASASSRLESVLDLSAGLEYWSGVTGMEYWSCCITHQRGCIL